MKWTIWSLPFLCFVGILLALPIGLSWVSILFSRWLGTDELKECAEFDLADNEFLPVYLGYCFLAVSISENHTLAVVYLIVFAFTFFSQTQYFNPIYLLFGYHYYHILTLRGTRIFVISKRTIRNKRDIRFPNLGRINDTTYIERS